MAKKTDTLYGQIKSEIHDFETEVLDLNPSFAPTLQDIIELIDLYWVSKYRDGDLDASGFKKAFFNIVRKPTEIASKMIDLDTKDIRIIPEDGASEYPAWFFGRELKLWLKSQKNKDGETFGQLLNKMVYFWPKYGHIVLKKAGNTIYLVPIQNLVYKASAKNILSSPFLIEKHIYTPEELKEKDWENVDKAIDKYLDKNTGTITVYERFGEYKNSQYNYFIIPEKAEDGDILYYDTRDKKELYKELKWEEVPKRALGRGTVEKLFENQIVKNQDIGLERTGLRWTSKHIFWTRDETIAKNLMTDIENGDLIIANSEIAPIAVEERNLAFYAQSHLKWDKNTNDLTFSHEPLSGERTPSGVTLGATVIQTRLAGQYFDQKREDLGMFLKDVLFDWVNKLMVQEFEPGELENLRGVLLTRRTNEAILEWIRRNKRIPTAEEYEIQRGIVAEMLKKEKEIEIPEGFYENIKYKIDIVITSEQIDIAARLSTLQTVLPIIGSNPTILQDKRTKKIFFKLLDLAGISPLELGLEEEPQLEEVVMEQVAQRGGSIAAPTPIAQIPSQTPTQRVL